MDKLGPTHKFPRGKVHGDDEGELKMAVATDFKRGVVVIEFGGPVTWLALEKDYALKLGESILEKAKQLPDG